MAKFFLTRSCLLVLLGGIFFLLPAYAQPAACDLQLRIQEVGVPEDIEGAEATAFDLDTKKTQQAVIQDGLLTFTGLWLLEQCREQFFGREASRIKLCVEKALEAERGAEKK